MRHDILGARAVLLEPNEISHADERDEAQAEDAGDVSDQRTRSNQYGENRHRADRADDDAGRIRVSGKGIVQPVRLIQEECQGDERDGRAHSADHSAQHLSLVGASMYGIRVCPPFGSQAGLIRRTLRRSVG